MCFLRHSHPSKTAHRAPQGLAASRCSLRIGSDFVVLWRSGRQPVSYQACPRATSRAAQWRSLAAGSPLSVCHTSHAQIRIWLSGEESEDPEVESSRNVEESESRRKGGSNEGPNSRMRTVSGPCPPTCHQAGRPTASRGRRAREGSAEFGASEVVPDRFPTSRLGCTGGITPTIWSICCSRSATLWRRSCNKRGATEAEDVRPVAEKQAIARRDSRSHIPMNRPSAQRRHELIAGPQEALVHRDLSHVAELCRLMSEGANHLIELSSHFPLRTSCTEQMSLSKGDCPPMPSRRSVQPRPQSTLVRQGERGRID